jgi:hypothetical protein
VARVRKRTNPFYALLIVVGIAFSITAVAYFVMALRGNKSRTAGVGYVQAEPPQGLLVFLDQYGVKLMAGELGLLALATWGAICTDHWWTAAPRPESSTDDRSA